MYYRFVSQHHGAGKRWVALYAICSLWLPHSVHNSYLFIFAGSVYWFGSDDYGFSWSELGKIESPTQDTNFGTTVALYFDTFTVGAPTYKDADVKVGKFST